jgi:hypothetical protein
MDTVDLGKILGSQFTPVICPSHSEDFMRSELGVSVTLTANRPTEVRFD